MPADGLAARREAALRLPPLADGRHDPDLELPPACDRCGNTKPAEISRNAGERLYHCTDRIACYTRRRSKR